MTPDALRVVLFPLCGFRRTGGGVPSRGRGGGDGQLDGGMLHRIAAAAGWTEPPGDGGRRAGQRRRLGCGHTAACCRYGDLGFGPGSRCSLTLAGQADLDRP